MEITPMNIKLKAAIDVVTLMAFCLAGAGSLVLGMTTFPKVTLGVMVLGLTLWWYYLRLNELKAKQIDEEVK
jgi:hypothetical protein